MIAPQIKKNGHFVTLSIMLVCLAILGFSFNSPQLAIKSNLVQVVDKVTVAIYPFTSSRSYSYEYASSVGNAVEAGFVRSGRFNVVERSKFRVLSDEDRFKEAQTSQMVEQASRLGAKTVVTGHVIGYSKGQMLGPDRRPNGKEYVDLSISFKIIDVKTGKIEMSETLTGRGVNQTGATAIQDAYNEIDRQARAYVATYLPQRFAFMTVDVVKERKKDSYLESFKIWGGSDNGLSEGDILQIFVLSKLVNPNTNEIIEEKKLIAEATVVEINSGATATCKVVTPARIGQSLLDLVSKSPDMVAIEYQGSLNTKNKSIQDILFGTN